MVVHKINLSTPIAHEAVANHFQAYYSGGASVFEVTQFFNRSDCKGIRIKKNAAVTASVAAQFDLYALTDGFLTFADNSLILRLPTELQAEAVKKYCSGRLLRKLAPGGPQLRHLMYKFLTVPDVFDTAIQPKISALLGVAPHPARTIVKVKDDGKVITLGAYLDANTANAGTWIASFRTGDVSLFVKAGDVIANFFADEIELQFVDSCGVPPASTPNAVMGRATNPSYFLHTLFKDTAHSNQLTKLDTQADAETDAAHPLMHLYRTVSPVPATTNADQFLDLTAALAPKPKLVTIDCKNDANDVLADAAIGIGTLGTWHKSRNSASEAEAKAVVSWRLYGNDASDTDDTLRGTLITQLSPPATSALLPGGAAFDHMLTPLTGAAADRVTRVWNLYHPIFNAVAQAFQVPCEILATIVCSETGAWFDNGTDTDVIRMEPLDVPVVVTPGTVLAKYKTLAGQNYMVNGVKHYGPGANPIMPRPWKGATPVGAGGPTWNELRDLVHNNPDVKVSPGCTQVLVRSAGGALTWAVHRFGVELINDISINVTNSANVATTLSVSAPPTAFNAIFEEWFGVALDSTGAVTTSTTATDSRLTRFQRALHDIITTAAYIKRNYNYISDGNKITDFDPPTLFSGYNDGASTIKNKSSTTSSDGVKWQKLYGVVTFDDNYPKNGSRNYNRIVRYFNEQGYLTANPVAARPALRLWPDS
jgi:hypothetical protein